MARRWWERRLSHPLIRGGSGEVSPLMWELRDDILWDSERRSVPCRCSLSSPKMGKEIGVMKH